VTGPLTPEEQSPPLKETEHLPRVAFQGNLEEVNHFFYRRGWTDGLPVVTVNDRVYGHVTPAMVPEIIEDCR